MTVTAREARKRLISLILRIILRIEQVNDDRQPIKITSKKGDAVLMSRADFDALTETASLLRSPANAQRLLKSLKQAEDARFEIARAVYWGGSSRASE